MTYDQIAALEYVLGERKIYWKDHDGKMHEINHINMEWVEFPDEPDNTEPAAIFKDGKAVALLNAFPEDFYELAPFFDGGIK